MAKFHRKLSKRITCRHKYKIKKKVAEHNRKLRREKKKNPVKSKPKDPGVPNNLPFKGKILQEAEILKQKAKEAKQLQKAKRKQNFDNDNKNQEEVLEKRKKKKSSTRSQTSSSTKPEKNNYKDIIDSADVILEVLDARDPLGSRCVQLEKEVIDANKILVLLLNKIDLIPLKNLEMWLKYFRQELPTFPFKSATETDLDNDSLSHNNVLTITKNEKFLSSKRHVGGKYLIQALKKYCQDQNDDALIKIGIVGFPNVGKSCVINSLKCHRSGNVKSSSEIETQEVSLNQHVTLLKIPGEVLPEKISLSDLALRNCLNEARKDVIPIAEHLLARADKQQLMIHYCVKEFSSASELLEMLCTRFGLFLKGGLPNLDGTARKVLKDWSYAKVKYCTEPPAFHQLSKHIGAKYVTKLKETFNFSVQKELNLFNEVSFIVPGDCIVLQSEGIKEGILVVSEMEREPSKVNASEGLIKKIACIQNVILPDSDDSDYDFDVNFQPIN